MRLFVICLLASGQAQDVDNLRPTFRLRLIRTWEHIDLNFTTDCCGGLCACVFAVVSSVVCCDARLCSHCAYACTRHFRRSECPRCRSLLFAAQMSCRDSQLQARRTSCEACTPVRGRECTQYWCHTSTAIARLQQ
ncbi:hypothetical protein BC830DRAFT_187639 [Chytriomyces sp. MP71]|nr:hypothetical protein BC830DRAFT_187639 [Chytriomyces sp. MP71]